MVRYVPDRAAVKVQYYVLCIYCSSAKSLQAEERNLQFLEQCITVASDKRFQGQSGAAATTLCFPGSRSIVQRYSCDQEADTKEIGSLLVHELNSCLLFGQMLPSDVSLDKVY